MSERVGICLNSSKDKLNWDNCNINGKIINDVECTFAVLGAPLCRMFHPTQHQPEF